MTLSLHADLSIVLSKFEDAKWEPGLDLYQEHLVRLNELVLKYEVILPFSVGARSRATRPWPAAVLG
jgi:hypothetical protein